MKTIKTIIVDDERRGLLALQKIFQLHCPELEMLALCDNADEAAEKITEHGPDLVFLDIAMPGKNGFDLLRNLPSIDFELIFITAHDNYMLQAFQFSAMDYLLKPVDNELLKAAVQRATKRILEKSGRAPVETLLHNGQQWDRQPKKRLCIPSVKGFQVVLLDDIIYCEGSGNYTIFQLTGKQPLIHASKPIHEYEDLLEDSGFIRIHKSWLINMSHIKEYQRGEGGRVVLSNDFSAEVSRRKKDLFISRMKEYFKY
jgi:two-component system, LytTR family, response regulator